MLTISQIAKKLNITNRQVHDLINYGYLTVSKTNHYPNKGIKYLFSEYEVNNLDVHSSLAEIYEKSKKKSIGNRPICDFKKVSRTVNYYENYLEKIAYYPEHEAKLLKICFYLFHLNHYAKTLTDLSSKLYKLKNKVLNKIYNDNKNIIKTSYLIGPDKKKIWLCEDCKDNARTANITYTKYMQKELYCTKCFIQAVEKEYYSLIEFVIQIDKYKYVFHLPKSSAQKWVAIEDLPKKNRNMGRYSDRMYYYGRSISRVEEKVFPVKMIIEELNDYLND
ncbi:hypothetical protein SYNTR_1106 [Candidatus Syntrophocurvum alkaliphilum]|uniref:Uncharacterized protein n=1 Tax=Candidatus Syntrophocurvum alkaliphilum TaxID=2293317 RepID=A0A6I6DBN7_9FIRM|nr:hypothetical protein [Candidatus Syntrophocurvum alkaliphilum]QGT99699.1 hypothetical protein SYNTR_1106 [Candidatus Syntrophocurvum alkaliphilum]